MCAREIEMEERKIALLVNKSCKNDKNRRHAFFKIQSLLMCNVHSCLLVGLVWRGVKKQHGQVDPISIFLPSRRRTLAASLMHRQNLNIQKNVETNEISFDRATEGNGHIHSYIHNTHSRPVRNAFTNNNYVSPHMLSPDASSIGGYVLVVLVVLCISIWTTQRTRVVFACHAALVHP